MYFYIFDPGKETAEAKYFERIQGRLWGALSEAHIEGESYKVTSIRTVDLLVEQAIGLDVKTLVVVGNDSTLNKAVNALAGKKSDITLGYIPLDSHSRLAEIFGMTTDIDLAVKTIAGRLTAQIDLGRIGSYYFLSKVDLGPTPVSRVEPGFLGISGMNQMMNLRPFAVKLSLDGAYTATSEVMGAQIINCRNNEGCSLKLGDPTDRLLDVLFLNKLSSVQVFRYRRELMSGCLDNVPGSTIMHAKKVDILGPAKLPLEIEGQVYTKVPAEISVAREKLKIIVGKGRQF